MNFKKPEKHTFFALDAAGALMSVFYLILIYYFDTFFGMPKDVTPVLIGIAIAFGLYSTTMYLIKPVNWPVYLMLIAILNYCYCLFTIYQVIQHSDSLKLFGYIYFVLEIIVIVVLATIELRVAGKARHR